APPAAWQGLAAGRRPTQSQRKGMAQGGLAAGVRSGRRRHFRHRDGVAAVTQQVSDRAWWQSNLPKKHNMTHDANDRRLPRPRDHAMLKTLAEQLGKPLYTLHALDAH